MHDLELTFCPQAVNNENPNLKGSNSNSTSTVSMVSDVQRANSTSFTCHCWLYAKIRGLLCVAGIRLS